MGWLGRWGRRTPFCIVSTFSSRLPDAWFGWLTLPGRRWGHLRWWSLVYGEVRLAVLLWRLHVEKPSYMLAVLKRLNPPGRLHAFPVFHLLFKPWHSCTEARRVNCLALWEDDTLLQSHNLNAVWSLWCRYPAPRNLKHDFKNKNI